MQMSKILCIVSFFMFLGMAYGQQNEATCPYTGHDKATATTSGIVCVDNAWGMWFPMPIARKLLDDIKTAKETNHIVNKQAEIIKLLTYDKQLIEQNLHTEKQIVDIWRRTAEQASKQLATSNKWYNSRQLWFTVGVISTIIVGCTSAYIYKSVR